MGRGEILRFQWAERAIAAGQWHLGDSLNEMHDLFFFNYVCNGNLYESQ
jgi:hypothetical protein